MKKTILLFIIILGFTLRFYQLGSNPPSLYWDEVALGYNAFSIAETARDEEGKFLPIQYFRSFGDFKPPVYIYAAVPMIKLFGLNEWTTRFPSAFFGSLSIVLTYLLTRQLFRRLAPSEPIFLTSDRVEWISILAALMLAISPWHTQISRVAYEANVSLFLTILGVWLFLKATESGSRKTLLLSLSGISFVLTFYTFNSSRVFTPLLVALLAFIYRDKLFKLQIDIRKVLIASILSIAILIPLLSHLASSEGQLRYKEVNIFSSPEPVAVSNARTARLGNSWWAGILNNRRILYAQNWLDGYFQHFSGKFLFITGDVNPRFSLQDVGGLYIIELPFILIGIYLILSRRKPEHLLLLGWMLLGPVPAAFARETPHALRSLNILPTFQIIECYAFVYILYKLNLKRINGKLVSKGVVGITAAILTFSLYYYQHNYFVHYPRWTSQEWQYGYKEAMEEVKAVQHEYDRIVVTGALGRPYIEALFYLQYPPGLFQKERRARTDQTGFGFIEVDGFNKYEFHEVNWKSEIAKQQSDEKVLLIGTTGELYNQKYATKIIKRLNGETVLIMSDVPKGYDALIELGLLDENGNPIVD
ncbi:MAG: glycosyltransferase family 39 protein [bacterium]|nr:glycosyltransferase family 39 protein [bacterium]